MRLAANEIERAYQQAGDEQRSGGHRLTPEQLDDLAGAFRRADELRRLPFGRAVVVGRKDGVEREVLTTQFTVEANGQTYRYVLMRYTEVQERGRRRTEPEYLYRRVGDATGRWLRRRPAGVPLLSGKDARQLDVRPLLPYTHHLLLVREDRLRR